MDLKEVWQLLRKLTFSKQNENYVGGYLKLLDFVGCWTGGDPRCQENRRLHPRYWLPRLTLSIMTFLSLVLSPVSIVQLWHLDLLTVLEPSTNFFGTCLLACIIGSLLYQGDSYAAMVAAYKEMKAFNLDSERFSSIYKEMKAFNLDSERFSSIYKEMKAFNLDSERFSSIYKEMKAFNLDSERFSSIYKEMKAFNLDSERFSSIYKEMKAFNPDSERFSSIYNELNTYSKLTYLYFALLTVNVAWGAMAVSLKALSLRRYFFGYWHPEVSYLSPFFEFVIVTWFLAIVYSFLVMTLVYAMLMTLLFEAIAQLKMLNMTLTALAEEGVGDRRTRGGEGQGLGDEESAPGHAQTPVSDEVVDLSTCPGSLKEAEAILKKCVQHHQANNKFVLQTRDTFHLSLTNQYAQTLIPTVFAILLVYRAPRILDFKILMYLGTVVGIVIHQGVFCWLSSQIEEESEAVRESVYGCQWQDASESFKRSIRVIMSFSNQPLHIKVAGFISLNMHTFYRGMEAIYTQYMSLVATERRVVSK